WGYGVVAIETAEGKAEYMDRQRAFSERAQALRQRLLDSLAAVGVYARESD
ncbi:MAG: 3-methyladenine DNA glycosylase, partial [Brevibacterium sp.]|nr:3-methyladenine DNA glycosylase [Brevibacterium sp.]